ncbi:MAG: acyl-CoA synthetase [Acidobacteriota bacterium]
MAQFRTINDVRAFEAKPLAERDLPANLYDFFARCAQRYGDKAALIFFLQGTAYERFVRFSYHDVLAKMTQTANMLHSLGVGPNDTVSYVLPNLPQTYFTLYGGEIAGIANPINPLLEAPVIAEIMNAAQTKVLVTLSPFPKTDLWEKMASVVNTVPTLQTILQVDVANYLHGVKRLLVRLIQMRKGKEPVRARVLDFDKTLARFPSDKLASGRRIAANEIAAYFHTGGTTGTPKLAKQTHHNQVFDGWAVGESVNAGADDINFLGLPLFHNYGAIAVGLASWSAGATVVMGTPQGFRGEGVIPNLWRILDHYQCTLFNGVPTLFSALLNVPIGDSNVRRVNLATCGAAALPIEVAGQFTARTGIKILEGYGLTEGTSVASVNPAAGEARIGSIGFRLPYEEMRTALVDGDKFQRFCEPNEIGLVLLRGPNVFSGYREEFHDIGTFVDAGDGGALWLNTGDLGRQDEDGYFWLTGRKKELIIRGGHNIDPRLIEEIMHQHPSVALAAAVGRPDPRVGETPVVYVELKPGSTVTKEELQHFAQERIGERAAIPRDIVILDKLPLTAVGKLFKPALIFDQVKQVLGQELKQIAGAASFEINVDSDKRLGMIAHVNVTAASGTDKTALETTIKETLGHYAVRSVVKVQ